MEMDMVRHYNYFELICKPARIIQSHRTLSEGVSWCARNTHQYELDPKKMTMEQEAAGDSRSYLEGWSINRYNKCYPVMTGSRSWYKQ
jgi:hypothetical protein